MRKVIITLELEDDKFDAMEEILLANGVHKDKIDNWDAFVINTYYDTERYLECNHGDLNKAYLDMRYDF